MKATLASVCAALLILILGAAHAAEPDPPCDPLPEKPAESVELLPMLKGIRLVGSKAEIDEVAPDFAGIDGSRIDVLRIPGFARTICAYLNRPVTLAEVNDMSARVVRWYRDHARPVVDVLAPEQDITNGTLQLLVLESHAGTITASDNKYFDSDILTSYIRMKPGSRFDSDRLLVDLTALNNNPFRQVDLVYERGEAEGTTNLILRTQDRWPYRVFVGYQNNGNASEGYDRYLQGFNLGNLWGIDHQFSYQLTTTQEFYRDPQHTRTTTTDVSYVLPIWNDDRLIFYGEWSDSRPPIPFFTFDGESLNLLLRYAQPLQRWGNSDQEIQWGFDYKKSNNNLAFNGITLSKQAYEVLQARFEYTLTFRSKIFDSQFVFDGVFSPSNLTGGNTSDAFAEANTGVYNAPPIYAYVRADYHHNLQLPLDTAWSFHFTGQDATDNLLSSEQLQLGGASLRGYIDSTAGGTRGILVSNELKLNPLHPLDDVGLAGYNDRFQPFIFVDYGRVSNVTRVDGTSVWTELASAGLGLNIDIDTYLTFHFSYGFPLTASDAADRAAMGHFSLTLAY